MEEKKLTDKEVVEKINRIKELKAEEKKLREEKWKLERELGIF